MTLIGSFLVSGFLSAALVSGALSDRPALLNRAWIEARTAHFNMFSCAPTQDVARVGARLEQFREAYSGLAGAQAVASPPIVVMVFPDHASMEPYLPTYQGKPANLAAFFHRDSDENLIALSASGHRDGALQNIFHEYTHLLLRHNAMFWPLWLNEGMADVYSTFTPGSNRTATIGHPLDSYLRVLMRRPLMPLRELISVNRESPEYNEKDRQGVFYAQSWLLTHYLMLGDNPVMKSRFGQLTVLLKQGQKPDQAFTNALGVSLTQMENQLRGYLQRARFEPLKLAVPSDLAAPRVLTVRALTPVAACVRLGNMLMRVNRDEAASEYFLLGRRIAPESPLPYEGLGLLAAEKKRGTDALRDLEQAFGLGSTNFLAHYAYAREQYRKTSQSPDTYTRVGGQLASDIQTELQKCLQLMPEFGPAHHMLGFFLMVQGENLAEAEKQLQSAIRLEPDNQSYLFSLAQAQLRRHNPDAALKTLEPATLSYVNPQLRQHAQQMIREIEQERKNRP